MACRSSVQLSIVSAVNVTEENFVAYIFASLVVGERHTMELQTKQPKNYLEDFAGGKSRGLDLNS